MCPGKAMKGNPVVERGWGGAERSKERNQLTHKPPESHTKSQEGKYKNFPRRIFEEARDAGGGADFATPPLSLFEGYMGLGDFRVLTFDLHKEIRNVIFDNFIDCAFNFTIIFFF